MKSLRITTVKLRSGRGWEWAVWNDWGQVGGGICRSKRDALNDAAIFAESFVVRLVPESSVIEPGDWRD